MAEEFAPVQKSPIPLFSGNFYDGSRVLTPISKFIGLPIDQTNYLAAQLACFILAFVYQQRLHSSHLRHVMTITAGMTVTYFCFGGQSFHIYALPTLSYVIMRTASPTIVHRLVLGFAMGYLSLIHVQRQIYDYGGWSLDITGPLMMIVQKVTFVAFALHDGLGADPATLKISQKEESLTRIPTVLEYYSYCFHFQTILAGPVVLFGEYLSFTDGKVTTKARGRIVARKILTGIALACAFIYFAPIVPIGYLKSESFLNSSFLYRTWYILAVTTVARLKYYHAWLLSEAICNASGLGYTDDNPEKWDGTSNVDILAFELGDNLRDTIASWNKCTNRWLRTIAYDRVKVGRTVATYTLSAVWHGFYPGYYVTFLTGAIFTYAARLIRRIVRPHMLKSRARKIAYDVVTFLATRLTMGYLTFSFVLLEFWPTMRILSSMYYYQHIMAAVVIAVAPLFSLRHTKIASK